MVQFKEGLFSRRDPGLQTGRHFPEVVFVPAENIIDWRLWERLPGTTPFLKCWGISPSGTILRKKPLKWGGIFSSASGVARREDVDHHLFG